ncbi:MULTISPECIES: ATP-binding protein [unclassified Novosphingobium]|uniref:ATP-binding protein n=1 Tax=unclassified Novosphingobium TaxID=2644732 RepID=UPI001357D47D|nr:MULTISPECIES: ATP-binding protein [unclassified Novosphingobium]
MTLFWPRSLFGKLLVAQIANIVVLAVALPMILSHTLAETADSFVAARLSRTAGLIAGHMDAPATKLDALARSLSARHGGRALAVFDAQGRLLAGNPQAAPAGIAVIQAGEHETFERYGRYDIFARKAHGRDGSSYRIVVAQDRTVPDEIVDNVVDDFLGRALWVLPVALLASLTLSFVVLGQVTGNFRRAAKEADLIDLSRLDARIDQASLPTESAPLVHATNRAIGRLQTGYHAQGEFIGNVAHELRTPLALLSLHTEQLAASPQREQLQADIEKANHVVRQLMQLAAIDRLHPECGPVDTVEIARHVVETMAPLVYRSGRSIALEAPDHDRPTVQGVPELLAIAVTNLIDNAVRHTPAGCAITVMIETNGSVVVEDDGPGIAIDSREVSRRRFRRGDTARSDSAGLGLSIVDRLMAVCGGALEAGHAADGGAHMRLRLVPLHEAHIEIGS